ncbi:2-oxoacid:acceptor oxidoreductase family protein [Pantoea sp. CTOTU46764]|uniref:2-oxoacid:acceptor oxidoreductase family protein n=1 Tax=Pantoea sp. CTOTU46764 TaxID=2953854 RepID=UPI0028A0F0AC|nr:2-oxoacid:acceptor oxidoreductase family protein [Pantoea sp. CTOTU46764]
MITVDGNGAVASVAFRTSEVIAIYPITPSSTMAELADSWSGEGRRNIWGDVPRVVEMQSEGGAIATVHGALQTGALSTTFTSSQGLLLMIPTLYKLAGQLTPFVLHVAARTVATHALSIFGDHSDVMAVRQTGCAQLCASSVQEAQDFALIAQIASLNSRIPFIHFFDGFRTSHEINKIVPISDETLQTLMPAEAINAHRARALTPDRPTIRGTSANPDTNFQSREATNRWYDDCTQHVEDAMNAFGVNTGRHYQPFEFYGHPQAERVIVMMGSGCGTAEEAIDVMLQRGEKVGLVKVRLYRPFSAAHLLQKIPASAQRIAVLDRTKEPGALGEPLFLDVITALAEAYSRGERASLPKVIGGRYGLSSKEFASDAVLAVFRALQRDQPPARFTVGIYDDVTHLSLPMEANIVPNRARLEALFYGLGSDGSVSASASASASKNNLKIIGNATPWHVQGYFVYDSKKAGGLTVSHLRVSEYPIQSAYLIQQADFIGCHQLQFIDKYSMLDQLKPGGIFLLNTPYSAEDVWSRLPQEVQSQLNDKQARFYVINAARIARECQLGTRINTVMQMAFFQLTQILPGDSALTELQNAIARSYSSKGEELVQRNWQALPEITAEQLERIDIRTSQLITPLFEYSGACSGCGETPYIKLLTQLYGDRLLIANATGCSSIYGGNLPSTPYTTNAEGRGPAWANSLFEDNAEFGLGFRLSVDQQKQRALRLLNQCSAQLPAELVDALKGDNVTTSQRREQIEQLRALLAASSQPEAKALHEAADALVEKSVWLIGGDGWAYDIGYGGLDHVMSLSENVNVLVLDTQCYSNTGGQASKATPLGAVTKFGEQGKRKARKDLGMSTLLYGHVYVAQISLGAQLNQTVKAIQEAEAWPGPSLIIAYSPCEEHGYDLAYSHEQMRLLTTSGFWPLYRFDPRRAEQGKAALALDSRPPTSELEQALMNEQRFRQLQTQRPEEASQLWRDATEAASQRYQRLAELAGKMEKSE